MQVNFQQVTASLGLVATAGIGVALIKRQSVQVNDTYSEFNHISQTYLPDVLDHFRELDQELKFRDLCESIECFIRLAKTEGYRVMGFQFQLNRLCDDINLRALDLIQSAQRSRDPKVLTASIWCEHDYLQYLNSYCQGTLRNILLSVHS